MSLFNRLSLIRNNNEAGNDGEDCANANKPRVGNQSAVKGNVADTIEPKAGIVLKTIKPGDITNYPKKGDTVTIHYEAFTEKEIQTRRRNPVPFDSSRSRGQVFHFRLGGGQVIEGLDVAVSKMSLGQEVEVTIPYPYAYGVAGFPPVVPPRATLIFRVELIRFSSIL